MEYSRQEDLDEAFAQDPLEGIPFKDTSVLIRAVRYGVPTKTRCLLKQGSDPNSSVGKNHTRPLMVACYVKDKRNRLTIFKLLLQHRANPCLTDVYGRSCVMYACGLSLKEEVELLIKNSEYDLNTADVFGDTALHVCAKVGVAEVLGVVLGQMQRYRLDISLQNNDHLTPLSLAIMNGHQECARMLHEAGGSPRYSKSHLEHLLSNRQAPRPASTTGPGRHGYSASSRKISQKAINIDASRRSNSLDYRPGSARQDGRSRTPATTPHVRRECEQHRLMRASTCEQLQDRGAAKPVTRRQLSQKELHKRESQTSRKKKDPQLSQKYLYKRDTELSRKYLYKRDPQLSRKDLYKREPLLSTRKSAFESPPPLPPSPPPPPPLPHETFQSTMTSMDFINALLNSTSFRKTATPAFTSPSKSMVKMDAQWLATINEYRMKRGSWDEMHKLQPHVTFKTKHLMTSSSSWSSPSSFSSIQCNGQQCILPKQKGLLFRISSSPRLFKVPTSRNHPVCPV